MSLIITPESAFKGLIDSFDKALVALDEAGEHFGHSILSIEELETTFKTKEEKEQFRLLVENYVLMSGFLLEHPLLELIRDIRETGKTSESDPKIMALNHGIRVGQFWKHYKGAIYEIVSVAKNSNNPYITEIHYTDDTKQNVWALSIHEFCKKVEWEGESVNRFTYLA